MSDRVNAENGIGTGGADSYEVDDSYVQASVIGLNGAIPQIHNFNIADDEDWVKFYAISDEVYEIKISNVGRDADPVIELYALDGTTLLRGPWSFGFEGEGELMDWICPADGVYYVKIYHWNLVEFGDDMGYELEIYRPIGPIFGFITGAVTNAVNGEPIAGAALKSDANQTAISLPNGSYIMGHVRGSFYITAEAPQYIPASFSEVVVVEGGSTTRNFSLIPLDNDIAHTEVKVFVTRFYQLCLSRDPDPAGLDGWVTALMDGSQTGSDVAYGFIFSEEFIEKNITNEEYLQVLYAAFFDRPPDHAGFQGWLDALATDNSRLDVLNGFIYAVEFTNLCDEFGIKAFEGHITKAQREAVEAFVTRFYQECLGRDPDQPGLEEWSNNLLDQIQTGADVANGFIHSQEFLGKDTANSEFLLVLYQAFFDRAPDQGGWDIWLAELDAGKDRLEVLKGFIYSQEFSELCKRFGIKAF